MGAADLALERERGIMAADDRTSDLSAFQLEVARLFFTLSASRGFLLAGGAALLAQHLTTRPTEDLDFFTAPELGHVLAARDALEAAAGQRGWSAQRIHDSATFCRMVHRYPRQVCRPRDTRARRLVPGRTASVLRNLAVRTGSVSRIS